MTNEITTAAQAQQVTAERADRLTAWWPKTLDAHLATLDDRNAVAAGIKALSVPADPAWLMARVAALLAPYYAGNVPEGVRKIEASDWMASLRDLPAWSIDKACRWWKGVDNPQRAKKPVEGDIRAQAERAFGIVLFGERKVYEFDNPVAKPAEPEPEPLTPEQIEARRICAAGILAGAGFTAGRNAAVRAAPMSRTVEDAMHQQANPVARHWSDTAADDSAEWQQLRASRAANALINQGNGA